MKYNQKGQVLILSIIVVGLVLVNTLLIIGGSQTFFQNSNYNIQSSQALNLAEAGLDKAIASLNATGGSYAGEAETLLGAGSFAVTVSSPTQSSKVIESTGFVPNKTNPKAKRTVKVTVSKGVGVAFSYGIQVGEGGLILTNNSKVNGSVYSNGSISMQNGAEITGDVYAASGTESVADQQNSCSDLGCTDLIFGKNQDGVLDIGQSFQPTTSNYLNKMWLKIKKVGKPPDLVVKILADNNGLPDKNNVLTSGTLPANLVTTQYSLVDVTFSPAPQLSANTSYWIVADTSASPTNYWSWSTDSLQGYLRGTAVWSPLWNAQHPTWNNIVADLDFAVFLGGQPTAISGNNRSVIGGNAHAHTLSDLAITKGAYYQIKNNITAGSEYPNSADPPIKAMPISEGNLASWKSQAENSGIYSGNINSCRLTLGPGKYDGNVSFANGCNVTIYDPIWITGTLDLNNNVTLTLNSSYGSTSGVIVVDGQSSLSNNARLLGSGNEGSYLMLLSTYSSQTTGQDAIIVSNTGNQGILYAPYGVVSINNNNNLSEITAWKINIGNGVEVNYDNGFASTFFSTGPTGSYSKVKGTYQIK